MTEAEIAEQWAAIAELERKRVKMRDGGKLPDKPKNQYNTKPKYDPKMDKTRAYNPQRFDDIARLRKEGKSNREIARILNVSDTSVRYWRRRYKIE